MLILISKYFFFQFFNKFIKKIIKQLYVVLFVLHNLKKVFKNFVLE